MPELPEVETTLRGIAPHIEGKTVEAVVLRQLKLRWQINPDLGEILSGRQVLSCGRRAKYLLIRFQTGVLLIHLGMSGSLRIFTPFGRTYRQAGQTRSRRYCVFRRHGHALPRSEKVRRDTLV